MVMEGEWFAPGRTTGDRTMTNFRKSMTATLAALTLGTAILATAGGAEARPRHRGPHWGVGAGIVGALAVGGLIAASASRAYAEPVYEDDVPVRRCELVERLNRFGEVVGHRRVCSVY
jgi:threonine dehydrogenase-like Zn-dependent dehydrogenase